MRTSMLLVLLSLSSGCEDFDPWNVDPSDTIEVLCQDFGPVMGNACKEDTAVGLSDTGL